MNNNHGLSHAPFSFALDVSASGVVIAFANRFDCGEGQPRK